MLISGPILRRASTQGVYVWLAFDSEVEGINAEVYKLKGSRREVVGQADAESLLPLKLGSQLFIYLIKLISHEDTFEYDQLYFYEVVQNNSQGSQSFFEKEGGALSYRGAPVDLPSFFLPQQHRHILQASCRRPHAAVKPGVAVIDQYTAMDQLMADSIINFQQRPSQLFLTGDQIYADDVSLPMLLLCSTLGRELTGASEMLPPLNAGQPDINPYASGKIDRRQYCNPDTGFTSDFAQHHLMSFAEYVAMYLLSLGGIPDEKIIFVSFEEAKSRTPFSLAGLLDRIDGFFRGKNAKALYEEELAVLQQFLTTAKKCRRVLANVPTYMILDDHDVTDDWNLTRKNGDAIRTIPFSRRLVCNALSAGWIFQYWGNDPERFGFLRDAMSAAYGNNNYEQLNGLEDQLILQRYWWGYLTPSNPPALVLDTRNRRAYDGDALALMDDSAFILCKKLLEGFQQQTGIPFGKTLILVSASPVFGFTTIEAMQLQYGKKEATKIDREPWVANLSALRKLKDMLMDIPALEQVPILAGDVHYGFSRYEHYLHKTSRVPVHFWQLTSSAICNIPPGKSFGQALVSKWLPSFLQKCKLNKFKKQKALYLLPENRDHFITSDTNIGLLALDDYAIPQRAFLYCADAELQRQSIWDYDLEQPKLLKL